MTHPAARDMQKMATNLGIGELKATLCPYYTKGTCRLGKSCTDVHPPELSPELRPNENYTVSDVPGLECQRCLEQSLPCDKVGRQSSKADPCSECRHFGGKEANCVLQVHVSRNDQLWKHMMNRSSHGYTLPAHKSRDEPRKKHGNLITPQPMNDMDFVSSWSGQTREQLLNLGDMFPEDVRARPRAYLKPPGLTYKQQKRRQWNERQNEDAKVQLKRKYDAILEAHQDSVLSYQLPQIPIPQPDVQRGPAESVTINLDGNTIISATVRYPSINGDDGVEVKSFLTKAA